MINIKEGNHKFYLGDNETNATAFISYLDSSENVIIIDHTYVSPELRGQNIAQQLVNKIVTFAREKNKKIIPKCSFAKKEFTVHKEYEDVLYK